MQSAAASPASEAYVKNAQWNFLKGLACRSHCEEDVKGLIRMIQNSVAVSPTASGFLRASRKTGSITGIFYIVLGAMFAGWGLHDGMSFIAALGFAFAVFGIVTLIRIWRITGAASRDT